MLNYPRNKCNLVHPVLKEKTKVTKKRVKSKNVHLTRTEYLSDTYNMSLRLK